MKKLEIIIGEKFGKRTVIADAGTNIKKLKLVKTVCECGTEAIVALCLLKQGNNQQCGSCYRKKQTFTHFTNRKSL